MKILFYPLIDHSKITFPQQWCDYQVDMTYHGLANLDHELDLTWQNPIWYNDYPNPDELYGRGFSVYCQLDRPPPSLEVQDKIEDKYYDQIIVAIHNNRHRDERNLNEIKWLSQFSCVKVIDGNDETYIQANLLPYCTYYKRELITDIDKVRPISFSIPENKIFEFPLTKRRSLPEKNKLVSNILPKEGGRVNWTYEKEEDYYKEYQQSWFAYTRKKGGWDSLRHYEIIANACIPIFAGIEFCPKQTLFRFPKELCYEVNRRSIDMTEQERQFIIYEFLFHAKQYLTTTKIAEYLLYD